MDLKRHKQGSVKVHFYASPRPFGLIGKGIWSAGVSRRNVSGGGLSHFDIKEIAPKKIFSS